MAKGLGQGKRFSSRAKEQTRGDFLSSPPSERRRWPRRPAERLLAYSWLDQNQEPLDMGMAKTVDLSEGGASILIHRPLAGGETLHLFMAVEEHLVETKARMVYQRPLHGGFYQVGACFLSMEEKAQRYLRGSILNT